MFGDIDWHHGEVTVREADGSIDVIDLHDAACCEAENIRISLTSLNCSAVRHDVTVLVQAASGATGGIQIRPHPGDPAPDYLAAYWLDTGQDLGHPAFDSIAEQIIERLAGLSPDDHARDAPAGLSPVSVNADLERAEHWLRHATDQLTNEHIPVAAGTAEQLRIIDMNLTGCARVLQQAEQGLRRQSQRLARTRMVQEALQISHLADRLSAQDLGRPEQPRPEQPRPG